MTNWWDKFTVKTPSFIGNGYPNIEHLETLTQKLTGLIVNYIDSVAYNAPMWVTTGFYNTIFVNTSFPQHIINIYHECAHLLVNNTLYSNFLLKSETDNKNFETYKQEFFISAEYHAEKKSLEIAHNQKDESAAVDMINIVFLDRAACKFNARKEHYYARERLLKDKEYLELASKYVNVDKMQEYGRIWEECFETNPPVPIKIIY